MALWGTSNIGSVTQFQLFSGGNPISGILNASGGTEFGTPAQVFSFAPVVVTSVDIVALNLVDATVLPGIGEIVFQQVISEPTSLALIMAGLIGLLLAQRRLHAGSESSTAT